MQWTIQTRDMHPENSRESENVLHLLADRPSMAEFRIACLGRWIVKAAGGVWVDARPYWKELAAKFSWEME